MCMFISGIAVKTEDGVKVYMLDNEDSHTKVREKYNIRDDDRPGSSRQTPVEFVPVRGLEKPEDYDFRFDAEKPNWWTDDMTEAASRDMFTEAKRRMKGGKIRYDGYLFLSSLTSIPKGVKLSAGGNLDLSSLTSIPKGVKLSAGGGLFLSSLTSIPKGVKLSAEGGLDLRLLTSIPKGVHLSSGWYLDLSSLTSLPDWFERESVNGKIYLRDGVVK